MPPAVKSRAFLLSDNWDDWFRFSTLYSLIVFDDQGSRHEAGGVKIGRFSMAVDERRPGIPDSFDRLDQRFFSLGQDDSYYDTLNQAGEDIRNKVLSGLRDIAVNLELFDQARQEPVTGMSLLRFVTAKTVKGQFHRLANGEARLTPYSFSYVSPTARGAERQLLSLQFEVEPESQPPTNIHVLIGRNGVGKTHLLRNMTQALADPQASKRKVGYFTSTDDAHGEGTFANIVSVTFSAFDPFLPIRERRNVSEGVQYTYIGLQQPRKDPTKPAAPRSPAQLTGEFVRGAQACCLGATAKRWKRALESLEADPLFREAEVTSLAVSHADAKSRGDEEEWILAAKRLFKRLSSGHKVVLLTITRLVQHVTEGTLVLLDEPEAHLHPPLLSAFVRALSDLLVSRNGVAIIATHSPVVLQEVPRTCVWKIRRSGNEVRAERPESETFGENVGILTSEIFGLEVTEAGFHTMLEAAALEYQDYEDVIERFDNQLGAEAKAIIRALVASPPRDDAE
jgi:predicted ATPase